MSSPEESSYERSLFQKLQTLANKMMRRSSREKAAKGNKNGKALSPSATSNGGGTNQKKISVLKTTKDRTSSSRKQAVEQ